MHVLFVRPLNAALPFEAVASLVSQGLLLDAPSERDSANYEGGTYYRCSSAQLSTDVCLSDGSVLPEYPFWLFINAHDQANASLKFLAECLVSTGFAVFAPAEGWAKKGWIPTGQAYLA